MSATKPSKTPIPNIVKVDKALKLAEQWVNGMTKSAADDTAEEPEGRPPKLGLGARVPRQSNLKLEMSDPIARKLNAKLNAEKRKNAKNIEESQQAAKSGCDDEESDEDMESRTNAFSKKRAAPSNTNLPKNKKCK